MKCRVRVIARAELVKVYEYDVPTNDEGGLHATIMAGEQACVDLESGDLSGWDLTPDCEIISTEIDE